MLKLHTLYNIKSKTSVLNHVFIFVKIQRKIEQLKSLTIFSDCFITMTGRILHGILFNISCGRKNKTEPPTFFYGNKSFQY